MNQEMVSSILSSRRRVVLTALIAGACGAAACGAGAERDSREPAATSSPPAATTAASADPDAGPVRPRIVALGDSLTAGYGLLESQSYPALLQRRIDENGYEFEVINAGVSGDTSAGGLRRLDWSLEGDVRVLILALGANDGLRGLSIADMRRNLETIIARAREQGAVVILAGMEAPPNYGQEYATAFRAAFQDLAREQRVLFLPFLLDNVAGRSDLNLGDGIHPNERGTAVVADTVWRVLQPVLDQMSSGT
jgi:acyl-CoA thioesterase-1